MGLFAANSRLYETADVTEHNAVVTNRNDGWNYKNTTYCWCLNQTHGGKTRERDKERGDWSTLDSPFVLKFNHALEFTVIRCPAPACIDQQLWVSCSILFVWPVGCELMCWTVEQDGKVGEEEEKSASDWSAASLRTAERPTHTSLL